MLSRRDKVLILPWQQRKYENHLRKVRSAAPVIDNRPPANREHVITKLKRKQTEIERCSQIEKDNLILLRKLNFITRTNRVDNYWSTPQPNFLNRVGVYNRCNAITEKSKERPDSTTVCNRIRQAKCVACSPIAVPEPLIPEERVPWEPEKPPVGRTRSQSVPIQKLPVIQEVTESSTSSEKVVRKRSKTARPRTQKDLTVKSPQSITLSRGSLVLEVNFPSDSFVKFQDGKNNKLITRGLCQCKNVAKACG
ncbi:hypothetical protein RN001_008465 [Aquatica leii]|uniref:Uncharacterized protein n=1 Tax=Aquatica leii TaxID=1421715 RepID=A0AAN7SH99_9COLE|nr:hypothetical protein RN001_008465 [Aquatica leii]